MIRVVISERGITDFRLLMTWFVGLAFAAPQVSCAQDLCSVCCYVTGSSVDVSPYVEVTIGDKRMETLGPQEYQCMLVSRASARLFAHRDGLEPKSLMLGEEDVQVYQIAIDQSRWSLKHDPNPPVRLLQQGTSLLEKSRRGGAASQKAGRAPLGLPIRIEWMKAVGCPDQRTERFQMELRMVLEENFMVVNRDVTNVLLEEQRLSMSGLGSDTSNVAAGELVPAQFAALVNLECTGRVAIQFVNSTTSIVECSVVLAESTQDIKAKLEELLQSP